MFRVHVWLLRIIHMKLFQDVKLKKKLTACYGTLKKRVQRRFCGSITGRNSNASNDRAILKWVL